MAMTIEDFLGSIRDAHGLPRDRTEPLRQALLAAANRGNADVPYANGSATAVSPAISPAIEAGVVIGECRIREHIGADSGGVTFGGDDGRGGKVRLRVLLPADAAMPVPPLPPDASVDGSPDAWRPGRQSQVLPVRDVRLLGGFVCVCRDAIDGEDLASVVRVNGPLPADAVRDCILQVARSLGEIHAAGFAHGELTAEQFLLDDDGAVRIQTDRPFRPLDPATAAADVRSVCRLHAFLLGRADESVGLPGEAPPVDFERLIALLDPTAPRQPSASRPAAVPTHAPANGHVKPAAPAAARAIESPAPQAVPKKSRGGAGLWIGLAIALVAVIALCIALAGN
jgi:hypothetical protein